MNKFILILFLPFSLIACQQQSTDAADVAKVVAVEPVSVAPVPPSPEPVKPSFDCAKAQSEAETMVCADFGLADLDNRLDQVYAAELAKPRASKELAAMQRGWIKGRDECWKADDKRMCIEQEYRTRIAELQINSPDTLAASTVEFICNDSSKPFTMSYYNEIDNKPAVITLGKDQAIIFPQPAASGAKYGRQGIEYWEHQGEASINFFDIKLKCTAIENTRNL